MSHPVRVRGLKLLVLPPIDHAAVAPRAGAWVETYPCDLSPRTLLSHPVRVRGLKLVTVSADLELEWSHPVRVRGLKHIFNEQLYDVFRRTPCGCVG